MSLSVLKNLVCFNPSFYLDASGSLIDKVAEIAKGLFQS